jgi:HEAT repeat protein
MIGSMTAAVIVVAASTASAYVEIPYTLGRVVNEASNIVVLQVEKVNKERRLIYYRKIADLKGKHPSDTVNHQIANGFHPREPKFIMDWAEPGKTAIFFHNGGASETCIGDYWYQAYAGNPWWGMSHAEPFMCWSFSGSTEKLRQIIVDMLAGKEVVVPCAQYEAAKVQHYKNLLHEKKAPLWRMKASLKIGDYEACMRKKNDFIVGLGALGPEAVPAFIKALEGGDAAKRIAAIDELGGIGSDAKAAVPALLAAARDADRMIAAKALAAAAAIEPENPDIVPALTESLQYETGRPAAAAALARLGARAKPALPALNNVLKDSRLPVRLSAAEAILNVEPANPAPVAVLSAALKDPDREVRVKVLDLIGRMGPAATPAAGAVGEAIKDADAEVKAKAAELFLSLAGNSPAAVPALLEMMKGDREAKIKAATLIAQIGPGAKDAVNALVAVVQNDQSGTVRRTAAAALARIGSAAKPALPQLKAALNGAGVGARADVRAAVAEAIKAIEAK